MSTPLPAPHTHTLKLQPNMLDSEMCDNSTRIQTDASPVLSAVMFLAGVTGNLTALAILRAHRRECHAKSVFYILVTGLVVTDLLGTCVLSPPVFLEYARDASLLGLGGGSRQICNLFGFTMAFFGLCSTLILTAMALERCLAISHPYFYSRRVHGWYAKGALSLAYVFTSSFCLLPFVGAGQFSQYCPGTWCYVQMEVRGRMGEGEDEAEWRVLAFSLTYSSLMLMLVVVVCLCNGSVIASLCRMQRHGHWQLGRPAAAGVLPGRRRNLGPWFSRGEEEADHLLLLGCMTIIFIICSLPLTVSLSVCLTTLYQV
ncbi:hypothetical protein JZ751_022175 [Albula glossodonta]|uniref:G-protein coupled receptors family 1 profile domain-containing protein n=1 Tax=Albula glossodonta TaxID=121402 RepID=A0A8T2MQS4_9TELE|nr:hypothetical protein JZ751_022175 [Albula glossodonta]